MVEDSKMEDVKKTPQDWSRLCFHSDSAWLKNRMGITTIDFREELSLVHNARLRKKGLTER